MSSFVGVIFWIIVIAFIGIKIYSKCEKDKQNKDTEKWLEEQNNFTKKQINKNELPANVVCQLLNDEKVYYFSFLSLDNGGCLNVKATTEHYWICLTDKRILYKAKIQEGDNSKLIERNGIIPFDKISYLEITDKKEDYGCMGKTACFDLKVGNSGGVIGIPIPTERKGFEIRKIYMELLEDKKGNSQNENN